MYICLFVRDMVGWVILLSFLSYFFKLVCYAHVFPCTYVPPKIFNPPPHAVLKAGHPGVPCYNMSVRACICPTQGSSFFLGKVTALGVLCCFALFVCLNLLASFFLPSHLSLKTCIYLPPNIFNPPPQLSRLGIQVSLATICLFVHV